MDTTTHTATIAQDEREPRRHPILRALGWIAVVAVAIWPFPVW